MERRHTASEFAGFEQRKSPRIYIAFPVKVKGQDAAGRAFEVETVVDDLSTGGLYVRIDRMVPKGAKLQFVISLATRLTRNERVAQVTADGVVLRSSPQPDGKCGLGVRFTHYRA